MNVVATPRRSNHPISRGEKVYQMEGHAESCIVLEQRELSGDGNKKRLERSPEP
jgi:hypothetical protein